MVGRPKNPQRPSNQLTRLDSDVVTDTTVLWRIHRVGGPHALPWNGFRAFGPLHTARFDPHPLPVGSHAGFGVIYAGHDMATCVAEVFQGSRAVHAAPGMQLAAWEPVRPLRLLDLTGGWALRNGAAHSLFAAPRATCRAWSRAIHQAWTDVDGLLSPSTMTGRTVVTLFERSVGSIPPRPQFARPLTNPYVWRVIADAASEVGYGIH